MRIKNKQKKEKFHTIKSVALMAVICVMAMFYIWQHIIVIQLGYKIKKNEIKLESLLDDKARMELVVSRLETPKNIEKLLAMANLNLSRVKNPKVIIVRS